MPRSYSLTSARSLAPDAFRRWVLVGISIAVLGYAAITAVHARENGLRAAALTCDFVMVFVCTIGLLIAARVNEVIGCTLVILATWVEVETALHGAPVFPTAGLLVLPTLVLAAGLLLGARAGVLMAIATIAATVLVTVTSPVLRQNGVSGEAIYWLVMHVISVLSVLALHSFGMAAYRRVFEAMEANEQDLADTIRFAPDGILVATRDGTVLQANPAAEGILRLPRAEIVNHTVSHVLTSAGAQASLLESLKRDDTGAPFGVELTRDGQAAVHLEMSWRKMERGRDQYLLRDVSQRARAEAERREMELQLSHAQRLDAVGRLAGGLSHDFNNILTAVSGSAEMLRITKNPRDRAELVDEIIAARDRGAALTRQLLAFARREVVQPQVIDLAQYVRGVERLLQRVAGDRQRLRFELVPGCHVRVDPGQLEQSLLNLVANARDAMPNGGTCTISVMRSVADGRPARALLCVSDDGVGMSPEILARAFEPFFTTKARGQGTGLGLASVHGMAEQSEGTASITSTPGHGTQVTLELPLVDAAPPSVKTEAPVHKPSASAHTVLVAEDDAGTRRVVERILRHAGYDVIAVNDGVEAMTMVDSSAVIFDLLVSDVMMPGHTGPQLADRMRTVRPETPVLLMTGYAEEQLSELLDARSGREIITKPFAAGALEARIATLLHVPATAAPRPR